MASKLFLVLRLEQIFDCAFGQLREGFVRGCENREWSFRSEFPKSRSLDRSDKRFELPCVGSDCDDRLLFGCV